MTIDWLSPADPGFSRAAELFDDYRVHYGCPSAPAATAGWLAGQLGAGRLRLAAVVEPDAVAGFVTVAEQPASLLLGSTWSIRDLYVPPGRRRRGLARALLGHVIAAARSEPVLRIALQTEPANTAALALYRGLGFEPVTGLVVLNRGLR